MLMAPVEHCPRGGCPDGRFYVEQDCEAADRTLDRLCTWTPKGTAGAAHCVLREPRYLDSQEAPGLPGGTWTPRRHLDSQKAPGLPGGICLVRQPQPQGPSLLSPL